MSKIKKYIITIIVMIIGILCCNLNSVKAYNLATNFKVNGSYSINGAILRNCNNVLCVQHGVNIRYGYNYNFICKNKIVIEGNVSKGKKGSNYAKTYTSEANGTLAYLLSSYRSQVGYQSAHANDQVQIDIWRYISTWKNSVGKNYDGLSSMSMTGAGYNNGTSNRIQKAKDYAKNVDNQKQVVDKTNKENVKTKMVTIGGKEYAQVGPFKFEFEGSLKDKLKVTNSKDETVTVAFIRYDANNKLIQGSENMKSNKNFYVLIRSDRCEKIKDKLKIKVVQKYDVKKVTIYFLSATYAQNLIKYNYSTTPKENVYDFEYDVKITGGLRVIKVDKDSNTVVLPEVGFVIQNKDTGKYVKQDSNGNITYVEREQATEFVTGKDGEEKGKITINNLLIGTYVAYETKNPNNNYEILKDGVEKDVVVDKTAELKIPNERKKGNLLIIKVDENNNEMRLNGVEFIIKDDTTGKYVKRDSQGNITYVKKAEATTFVTGANGEKDGEITINNLSVGDYTAIETKNPNNKYKIIDKGVQVSVKIDKTEELKIYNERHKGNLKVIKVDADNNEVKLNGVKFVIKFEDYNKYVKRDDKGNVTYVNNKEEATVFVTGENGAEAGEILIENLFVGTYTAYETENPNSHYEIITEGKQQEVKIDKTEELKIPNKQINIDLSGYVWVDENAGKKSLRNDLYNQNTDEYQDNKDQLLNGITVKLMRKGKLEPIATTQTSKLDGYVSDGNNGNGEYLFKNVPMYDENDKERNDTILDEYYIEFEYDGVTYTNVVAHIDLNNGSKASENAIERQSFNNKFSVIDGSNGELKSISTDGKENVLSYTRDKDNYKSTVQHNETFIITAKTSETGYNIEEHREVGKTEIRYINLGIQRREQPQNVLVKDLHNVRLGINGYQHLYYYDQKSGVHTALREDENNVQNGEFNVGVKFENSFNSSYRRAVYKADIEYTNEDTSKQLKAYMTYKIEVTNETTNLKSEILKIADYYDSRYTLISAGKGIDAQGKITDAISYQIDESYSNNGYSKAVITTNYGKIEPNQKMTIYLEFELKEEAVLAIMNQEVTLKNVAEILSYSTFDKNDNIYAGIDSKSIPGNADPNDRTTFEDDTDIAPTLILEIADARQLKGKVFEDGTTVEANIRQGDGKYLDGEKGIAGVKVTLKEISGSGKIYEATTDENGDFTISGFIPGDYTLTYTWGDETYTVQNYKATIYDKTRYDTNSANKQWYKTDVDTRWTDAIDNYEIRQKIDDQMSNTSAEKITKMDSTTPVMGFGVEYETTYTASTGDRYVYEIKNVDFGIALRPRQAINIDKKVSNLKLILANGSEIVNAEVVEGALQGLKESTVYLAPTQNNNGMLKIELTNELIQGANVIIDYEILVENKSEKDYISEEFYTYGIQTGEEVQITPTGVFDYLDSELTSSDGEWEVKTLDQPMENKTVLYNQKLTNPLKAGESNVVSLQVSKVLSTSDEIELDNEAEITEITKNGGSEINGYKFEGEVLTLLSKAETVVVTPSTGENRDYTTMISIAVSTLAILGAGIVLIKKKILIK